MSTEIQSGSRYIITNRKGGTVIDLSGADNKSIIGYTRHGGENQQWEPIYIDDENWIIKNVQSGHYLGYEGSPSDGNKLVATDQPLVWHIRSSPEVPFSFRISVPNSNQDVDLSDRGNPTPGTPIATWGRWEGLNQLWQFSKV